MGGGEYHIFDDSDTRCLPYLAKIFDSNFVSSIVWLVK